MHKTAFDCELTIDLVRPVIYAINHIKDGKTERQFKPHQ